MVVQPTFDLEPEEPRKRGEKIGRVIAVTHPKMVQIGLVFRELSQFSRMQGQLEQTLVFDRPSRNSATT